MIGDYLDVYTFEYLIKSALENVSDELDKREGSVIYDAIAPACYELAEMYMQLKQIVQQTFVSTSSGDYLNLRVAEQGLTRYPASYAVKKAEFRDSTGTLMSVPIGSRFSTIVDSNSLNYAVTAQYTLGGEPVAGTYELTCETLGTSGNTYVGQLLPITYIVGLATATMINVITPARDEETDAELIARYTAKVSLKTFGGNIAQYREMLKGIAGVGAVQIYTSYSYGGNIILSLLDSDYNKITPAFAIDLMELLDPLDVDGAHGAGLGMVPIGHAIEILIPLDVTINVSFTIALKPGYTVIGIQANVEQAISDYLLDVRKLWESANSLNQYASSVYIARVSAAILAVEGILNVTNLQLNSGTVDIVLTENRTTQQIPVLGTVTISE